MPSPNSFEGPNMAGASPMEEIVKIIPQLHQDVHLTSDLWRLILQRLPVSSLALAACVCRLWHSIARDPVVLANAFKDPWKLSGVVGKPSSTSFWRDASLGRFAISHTLRRWDTVAGLAVKYQVHVIEIMRLNNMMSDHGIHSRERLLIPVVSQEVLEGRTCYIEMDSNAKREVAVLYLDGEAPKWSMPLNQTRPKSLERMKREVFESMKSSLQVDDGTARYYLSLAEGDLRVAFSHYNEDLKWEELAGTHQSLTPHS